MKTEDTRTPLCAGTIVKVQDTTYIIDQQLTGTGGQALLYQCHNTNGAKFCLKEYYPFGAQRGTDNAVVPAAGWDSLRNGIRISRELAKELRESSHQGVFLPFQWDEKRMAEVMILAPNDCCILSDFIKLDMDGVSCEARVKKAAEITRSLLRVLRILHEKHGLLHADIKPENIFWAEDGDDGGIAFPIDFATCCKIGRKSPVSSFSSGFSHPFGGDELSIQRDLYSVGALFLSLAGGRNLMEKCPGGIFPDLSFQPTLYRLVSELNLPADIRWKFLEILKRATSLEENLQYTFAGEFRKNVEVLLEIIENKGLHRETLLKNSRIYYDRLFSEIYGTSFDGDLCPEIDGEIDGKKTQLCSAGGCGKTTTFFCLWKQYLDRCENSPYSPIPIYVQLNGFTPEKSGWETYILDAILSNYSHVAKTEEYRTRLLNLLKTGKYIFLFDAIGEAVQNSYLMAELKKFVQTNNLSLCISTRTPLDDSWSEITKHLSIVSLKPLSEGTVLDKFREKGFAPPSRRLLEILRRPMFLAVFLKLQGIKKDIETPGELLTQHHIHLIRCYQSGSHGSDREDVQKLVMDEILPEFAYRMNEMRFETNAARGCLEEIIKDHEAEPKYGDAIAFQLKDGQPLGKVSAQLLVDAGIIRRVGAEELVFYHQNYLHFYIARYIYGRINREKLLPQKPLPHDVRLFLGDLLGETRFGGNETAPMTKTSPVEKLLEEAQKENDVEKRLSSIAELVEVMKTARKNKLSSNFDGLDLSLVDFSSCDLSGSSFKDAVLPESAFFSHGHCGRIYDLLPIANTSLVVTVAAEEHQMYIWDCETGTLRKVISLAIKPSTWAVSPDGSMIAIRDSNTAIIYSLETGAEKTAIKLNVQELSQKVEKKLNVLDFTWSIVMDSSLILLFSGKDSIILNCGPYLLRVSLKGKIKNGYLLEDCYRNRICDGKVMSNGKNLILLSCNGQLIIMSKFGFEQASFSLPEARNDYCQLEISDDDSLIRVGWWQYGLRSSCWHLTEDGLDPIGISGDYTSHLIGNYIVRNNQHEFIWQPIAENTIVRKQINRPTYACLSGDGTQLVVANINKEIRVFDLQSGITRNIFRIESNKNACTLDFAAVDGGASAFMRSQGPVILIKPNAEKCHLSKVEQQLPFCYRGFDGNYFIRETADHQHLEIQSLLSGEIVERVETGSSLSKELHWADSNDFTPISTVTYIPEFRKIIEVSTTRVGICDCKTARWNWLSFSSPYPQLPPPLLELKTNHLIVVVNDMLLCADAWSISQWDLEGNCLHRFGPLDITELVPSPESNSCLVKVQDQEKRLHTKIWDMAKMDFVPGQVVNPPIWFNGTGQFRIHDKSGKILREIVVDTVKNSVKDFRLSDSGDTFVILLEDQTLLVYGIYDHALDKVIPALLPTSVSNCDFSGARMSENLKGKIKKFDPSAIF